MFALRETFDRDRFRSAHAIGTQVGLAGSMAGVREFLSDPAFVTTPAATAVLDDTVPARAVAEDLFGVREDPAPGLAHRVYHEEYRGEVGETLLFRLLGVDRLREAMVGTPWTVAEHRYDDCQWRAILEKA